MRAAPLLCAALLVSCGRYDDFSLPPLEGSRSSYIWTFRAEPLPVLTRGAPGTWDAVDVLNPSVVRARGEYVNYYSGFDGRTWRTGTATSLDGRSWTKGGQMLSPDPRTWEGDYIAANGSAIERDGEFLYWYQAGKPPRIGLARSADGRRLDKHPAPVLALGPRGAWDERAVADPYVIAAGGRVYMYYLGMDRAARQRLGVAVSDDGVRWTKLRRNPVLELGGIGEFDERGLGEPAVWASHEWYWMLYTGRDRDEVRRLGLARSRDGVRWEKERDAVFSGAHAWNSKVLCDPSVESAGSEVRVWFGGGDAARPDERVNGQIGFATLTAK